MVIYPVILAGGSGTRLWPLSRRDKPKQFLPLIGKDTLFQETLSRLKGMRNVAPPIIVCNQAHEHLVSEQAKEMDISSITLVLEPEGRNTAPALALAALALKETAGGHSMDPVMLVMPADHIIKGVKAFQEAVAEGADLAEKAYLVTFGIVPTSAHTGYGYIRKGEPITPTGGSAAAAPMRLSAFVEKPDAASARSYFESGQYLWNSGIFMMKASLWLRELERYRPDILAACSASFAEAKRDGNALHPNAELFAACPSQSIDYAVMEKAAIRLTKSRRRTTQGQQGMSSQNAIGCAVVPLDAGWSDLGAWSTVWEESPRDAHGNVFRGEVYAESVKDSLLIAGDRLLAAVGLEDVIVVETGDAVLVVHKDRAQDVKEIVDRLEEAQRPDHADRLREHRVWGSSQVLANGPGFLVRRFTIKPEAILTFPEQGLQAQHWVVVSGRARITRGAEAVTLKDNESLDIPAGVARRLENRGKAPLELIAIEWASPAGKG